MNKLTVKLTYFKRWGKFYGEGEFEVDSTTPTLGFRYHRTKPMTSLLIFDTYREALDLAAVFLRYNPQGSYCISRLHDGRFRLDLDRSLLLKQRCKD